MEAAALVREISRRLARRRREIFTYRFAYRHAQDQEAESPLMRELDLRSSTSATVSLINVISMANSSRLPVIYFDRISESRTCA